MKSGPFAFKKGLFNPFWTLFDLFVGNPVGKRAILSYFPVRNGRFWTILEVFLDPFLDVSFDQFLVEFRCFLTFFMKKCLFLVEIMVFCQKMLIFDEK